ncbi:MAG TPA: hypothetical protein VFG14_05590 [Chthoniobacteraceae bacterium]|nr:hypothetical protein [Chthoniobacteraceae bacterium]
MLGAARGNLLAFFETYTPWLEVYPINLLTLKRFRETFVLSRANDDGKDALYLARCSVRTPHNSSAGNRRIRRRFACVIW